MRTFETLVTVALEDLDDLDHVNNVRYVQWAQEVAKQHWLENTTKAINQNYFWVVLNHYIEYKSSAFLNDVIKLKTYITKSEGAKSTRIVEMYNNANNKLLVKSETVWCFMNRNTKRPARITPEVANLFN